jgi:hypothetical protein
MDSYQRRVHKLVNEFDKNLVCRRGPDGVPRVIQQVTDWTLFDLDGTTVAYPVTKDHLVFSLTDNWSGKGKPVEWGLEPIFQKLREISIERRDAQIRELEDEQRKAEELKEKRAMSKFEDIALETRDIYKKTFSDTLLHSVDMKNDVRRKIERKQNGYRK